MDPLLRMPKKPSDDMGPLFAHARASDPETSHEAAAKVNVGELEAKVLKVLRVAEGPKSSHDIAAILGAELVSISPRMKPLEARGLVERAGKADGRTLWRLRAA